MPEITLSSENVNDVLSNGVCVIKFWAPWCGPCKVLAPTFAELSQELGLPSGNITFAEVNIEAMDSLVSHFNIRNVPTILITKEGEEVARKTGNHSKDTLKAWILEVSNAQHG